MLTTDNLEHLITLYIAAIELREPQLIRRCSAEVQREADRVRYGNDGRIKRLHTLAEMAILED